MFVGLDGFNESLTKTISSTETELPITNSTNALSLIGENYTWLEITDGVYTETVKATNEDGALIMERTNGRQFVAGSCVRYRVTTKVVCDLISQGGCDATGTCTPVSLGAQNIPAAVIGVEWVGVIAFANSTSISVLEKPSWVTETISTNNVILKGTAPVGSESSKLVVRANGCGNSVVITTTTLKVCEQPS